MNEKPSRSSHERIYELVRHYDYNLYRRCIEAGEGVSLENRIGVKLAAEIEATIMYVVADALGLGP